MPHALRARRLRRRPATTLLDEGVRADMVYLDLGMSSMQVDTRERGFSYAYDAPLDMRMDPAQAVTAAEIVNTWEPRRLGRLLRDYGEERYADRIAKEIVRRRRGGDLDHDVRARRRDHRRDPGARAVRRRPSRQAHASRRSGSRSTTSSSQLDEALPRAWDLLRVGGRLAAISFHSLEDRRVKRFLADRTRGCICPPDLPVCGCGRTPQAELVFRRSVAPTPGEIADNARSKSARLRAARKLTDEEVRA